MQAGALARELSDHDVQHAVLPGFHFMSFELVEEARRAGAAPGLGALASPPKFDTL